ncbi:hypothetical protein SPAN111604_05645 [Sphingomonas antarctica]|uniref:hypothetical protein n=1 Tax=Sphingomonas antarctica TaxID=2040274 RepID=UPI0039EA3003
MARRKPRRRWQWAVASVVILGAVVIHAPVALAFPYKQSVGDVTVYAETPIAPQIVQVVHHAEALVAASPLADERHGGQVFLTDGGWRWHVLALQSSGAFALTRPLSVAVVVNRNDIAADRALNGRTVGGERALSGTIAHEWTHQMTRARYGLTADARYPSWLTEGFADHVAGQGSLGDAQAADLRRRGEDHPALLYYDGRKRVEAELRTNGGSVDALFAHWKSF